MNVGRIKPYFLSFALGLSRFVRSGRLAYLTSMSMQGTWADGIIIQAVADNLNVNIHITESHPYFAEFTVVEAATHQQQFRTICVGHLDECHYVSTKHLVRYICPLKRGTLEVPADAPKTAKQQCTFDLSLRDNSGCDITNYKSKQSVDQFGQKRAKYIRAYRANRSAYAKQKEASCKTSARLNQTPEAWQKRAEYMTAYHAKRSADAKQKEASYKRAYKAKKTLKPKEKACESQSSVMKQYRTNSKAKYRKTIGTRLTEIPPE